MVEEISPSQIRRQRFEMVRRGFDPQEVGAFLERVAEKLATAERAVEEAESRLSSTSDELEDAKAAEEALQLTMVAATQAKDEMLARAKAEADEVRAAAQREAEAVVAEARRQASALVEESRQDAGGVVSAARGEHGELLAQVDELREVVSRVRRMLASVAGSIDPALERAERMLADPAAALGDDDDEAADVEADFDVVSSPPVLEVVADVVEDEPDDEAVEFDRDAEEPPAVTAEPEAADEDDGPEDEAPAAPAPADAGGSDGGDEAAEVERLLRQLRGS